MDLRISGKLYICSCMGIGRDDIFKTIEKSHGPWDLDRLIELTGASEGCGTCINQLYACFEEALAQAQSHREIEERSGQGFLSFEDK